MLPVCGRQEIGPLTFAFPNVYSPQASQQASPFTHTSQPKQSGFPWRLMLLTGVLFGLTVLIYAGIAFGYRPYLEQNLLQIDAQLQQVTTSLQADADDVFGVYSQLYNIQSLSASHMYGSRAFTLLESGTLPSVRLVKADMDMLKGQAILEGVAADYDAVVNQVSAYRNVPGVSSAQLASAQANEDGSISFVTELSIAKNYFSQR